MSNKEISKESFKKLQEEANLKNESDELKSEANDSNKKAELEDLKEELKTYKDKLLRTAAEYENFRKRSEKEKEAIYSDALSVAVLGILPIMDSIEAALDSLNGQPQEYAKGIKLLKSQFCETLKNLKVEAFGEPGDQFDPSIHNAIAHLEDESSEHNVITKVFQKGYKSQSRIIRHAMVQVTN